MNALLGAFSFFIIFALAHSNILSPTLDMLLFDRSMTEDIRNKSIYIHLIYHNEKKSKKKKCPTSLHQCTVMYILVHQ